MSAVIYAGFLLWIGFLIFACIHVAIGGKW